MAMSVDNVLDLISEATAILALKVMIDIRRDMKRGRVPSTVRTFAELHDYVDANCYGGAENLLDLLSERFPQTDEGHTKAMNLHCLLMNGSMAIVDEWLAKTPPAERLL